MRFTNRFSAFCDLMVLIAFLGSNPLWAAAEHEEASIEFDSAMTLPALLDITLKRHPGSGVIRAGQLTAEAEAKYGRYWIPEMAEVSGFHLSDRQLDDIGAYENEVSLSVPFWLPGEKKAQTLLGGLPRLHRYPAIVSFAGMSAPYYATGCGSCNLPGGNGSLRWSRNTVLSRCLSR